jgi:uncharacterized membrane protein
MTSERPTAERLAAFSDAVFAVIVTIMVLALVAPYAAFALICAALLLHVDPRAPSLRIRT